MNTQPRLLPLIILFITVLLFKTAHAEVTSGINFVAPLLPAPMGMSDGLIPGRVHHALYQPVIGWTIYENFYLVDDSSAKLPEGERQLRVPKLNNYSEKDVEAFARQKSITTKQVRLLLMLMYLKSVISQSGNLPAVAGTNKLPNKRVF